MTLVELKKILDTTGYPVAYSHFEDAQTSPFICYQEIGTENFFSDDNLYKKVTIVQVGLYTKKKDLMAESKLEEAFYINHIMWNVDETFIESEQIFQRLYELELI